MRYKLLRSILEASGIAAMLVALGTGSYLPGRSSSNPSANHQKDILEFKNSCTSVTENDERLFEDAIDAAANHDVSRARQLYLELLESQPDNPVVQHNLMHLK